jgi:hypothetical protein
MRRVLLRSLGLGLTVVASGCANSPTAIGTLGLRSEIAAAEAQGFRVLTRVEVEHLIVGHAVTIDFGRASSISPPIRETFLPGGAYRVRGHRSAAAGAYRFQRNSVCISLGSAETCLLFLAGRDGTYFKKAIGPNFGPPEPIIIDHNS